ncbi:MAG: hypothetical protein ACOX6H_00405 [Christensenellales bacterium]|jgi:uncharacterized pyridoxamine 5'-phosphate oxidase family protein
MKKILSFLFIVVLLGFAFKQTPKSVNMFSFFTGDNVEFYCLSNVNVDLPNYIGTINNGKFLIVKTSANLSKIVYKKLKSVQGIAISTEKTSGQILQHFNVLVSHTEVVENQTHIFGFSACFDTFVFLKGKKINVHIVEQNGKTIFATPVIYTSY